MQETQETWVQSLGREDALKEEMANHSTILAWRIPWTDESAGQVHGVAKSWTQVKQLSTQTCTYNGILFSFKKKKKNKQKLGQHVTAWMDLENIIPSEINQTNKVLNNSTK